MPFRDAFDSAFDDVVAVDYLDFDTARKMLGERVLGMPIQFQALCFCLSGGLAREVVRAARSMVELAPEDGPSRDLEGLTLQIVQRELSAKAHAISASIEQLGAAQVRSDLLGKLQSLLASAPTAQRLYEFHASLTEPQPIQRRRRSGEPPSADDVKAVALAEEIATYAYFLAAILRMFVNALDQVAVEKAIQAGMIQMLANSLRSQSMNPAIARRTLDEFVLATGVPFGRPAPEVRA